MSSPRAPRESPEPIAAAKRTARAAVRVSRRARAALAADDPRRAAEAAAVAAAILPQVPPGGTVASYVALPTEPPTGALHVALTARGLRVIVPILRPDKDLDWAVLDGPDRPLGRHAIATAALIVVPALQVDRRGRRLGQGGGSYDRALARADPAARIVAVIDDDALVEQVPHEPHDALVSAVVRPGMGWTELPIGAAIWEDRREPGDLPRA